MHEPFVRPPSGVFRRLVSGWWRGETARQAWILTIVLGLLVVVNIGTNLAINHWNRAFFDALERRDGATLVGTVAVFAGLVAAIAGLGVAIVLTRETLQVRWRAWLVGRLVGLWLTDKRYYRLGLARMEPANPEYRIADDSRAATEPVVDFGMGLLHALLTAAAFVGILWSVGGSLAIPIAGTTVTIPAYMMLAALLYAGLASALTIRVGRPLVRAVAAKNEAEARLRFELTRLRENAEAVALSDGEAGERRGIDRTYAGVLARGLAVVRLHGRLTWITNGSGTLIPVIPLLLATPKYLSGELSLGAVTQLAAAFAQVQIAVAWLVDNYRSVAQWHASADRVAALAVAAEELDRSEAASAITLGKSTDGSLVLEGLTLQDRDGRVLVLGASAHILPGERVLLTGESGVGKSTLVRAMAGLWPWGEGRILVPRDRDVAFLPQRSYLPLGTLRAALLYPAAEERPGQDPAAALAACGLARLIPHLDTIERWDQTLSSGERQRLAFARLLLQRPGVVIMDEATSALDDEGQAALMALLLRELPEATLISVAHRPGLETFHDRRIILTRGEGGARLLCLQPAQLRAAG